MKNVRVFNYYGSKVQAAKLYPAPKHQKIIEPFAGGAGYSLRHRHHSVLLLDTSPAVVAAWQWLISATVADVLALPLLSPGQKVPADLPYGARCLIGFNCMLTGCRPQGNMVPAAARVPSSFWGAKKRSVLAALAPQIAHWEVRCCDWTDAPDEEATWFVDPPYFGRAGSHYRDDNTFDYAALGRVCEKEMQGQVIVCEGPEARWLPFVPHHTHASAPTADVKGRRVSQEVIWCRG